MKTIKKQLFVALVMMLVAAVALGTSTYAWFVNNAAPSVAAMDFTASTATALEVAVDKGATLSTDGVASTDLVYKGTIANADITAYHNGAYASIFSNLLAPTSIAAFSAIVGNVDGSNIFYGAAGYDTNSWKANKFAVKTPGADTVKKIPLWFRSTTDMKVFLKDSTSVVASAPVSGGNILSAEIDKALRVAFVDHVTGAAVIWNVNAGTFAAPNDSYARNTTINAAGNNATDGQAIASLVTTAGSTLDMVDAFATQTTKVFNDLKITDTNTNSLVDTAEAAGKIPIFSLAANTPTLIDVYIWLEGCDFQCVNEIAGGLLNINLNFIGGNVTI